MTSPTPHSRFSQDIAALLEDLAHQPLTLAQILLETSERGFSLAIGLLVLPFLFPMPPGLTTILGLACLLLSVQMTLGRRSPWLPQRIAGFQFPTFLARQLLHNLKRITRLTERLIQPRLTRLARSRHIWQINGACISWLTILLMLPIPMTNPIPTVGILIFVVATLEADGLMMCIGYGATGLITSLFGALLYGIWRTPEWLMHWVNSDPVNYQGWLSSWQYGLSWF
ncbi:exopolysaccharide biosynthesis protein [Synechococcales cyanobacterium C]|uniref:Exopolysaccharide biosynthesis protein n=1 Tax=Petrachloros mirabilis ULC683 TaxID=2781853 RepID=A0A8K2A242_9CYAN|nr:exopolysaccharide biosynthesis protein [Petrachloros mirabilis]NCJ08321.1 exopolysaccharide biosynthesis protein [Petrachloros mirabilis ULC683]